MKSMTTKEIANRLVELNRNGSHDYAVTYNELYAQDAISIENWGGESLFYKGLVAIEEKGKKWSEDVIEMHSVVCSEPLVADSSFAVTFMMDITYKSMGRVAATEMATYTVKDGKIVKEEFQA